MNYDLLPGTKHPAALREDEALSTSVLSILLLTTYDLRLTCGETRHCTKSPPVRLPEEKVCTSMPGEGWGWS